MLKGHNSGMHVGVFDVIIGYCLINIYSSGLVDDWEVLLVTEYGVSVIVLDGLRWRTIMIIVDARFSCAFFRTDYLPCRRSIKLTRGFWVMRESETGDSFTGLIRVYIDGTIFLFLAVWAIHVIRTWSASAHYKRCFYRLNHWLFRRKRSSKVVKVSDC